MLASCLGLTLPTTSAWANLANGNGALASSATWWTTPWAYQVAALILLLGALSSMGLGAWRARPALPRALPELGFIACSAGLFLQGGWGIVSVMLLLAAGAAFVAMLRRQRREPWSHPGSESHEWRIPWPVWVYLGAALMGAMGFLFLHLNALPTALIVWEEPVVAGFAETFHRGQGLRAFLYEALRWDGGLVSSGDKSLLYGLPTWLLFHTLGFAPWVLRLTSILALPLTALLLLLWGRQLFGAKVGALAAMVLTLNPCMLYYSRYGTSLAVTMTALLLALYATTVFVQGRRNLAVLGLSAGLALCLATLGYSPARLVLLIFLLFLPWMLWQSGMGLSRQRIIGLALLATTLLAFFLFQRATQHHVFFLHGRGEQLLGLMQDRYYIQTYIEQQKTPEELTFLDKMDFVYYVLRGRGEFDGTLWEWLALMSPMHNLQPEGSGVDFIFDPPNLRFYFAPLFPFMLWGLALSVLHIRRWPHAFLLTWLALTSLSMLMTNRVDTHRMLFLLAPFSLLAALGLWLAWQRLEQLTLPRAARHALAIALALCMAASSWGILREPRSHVHPECLAALAMCELIDGPLTVAAQLDFRHRGWLELHLLERSRRDPERAARLMNNHLREELARQDAPSRSRVYRIRNLLQHSTLLFVPEHAYRALASAMRDQGYTVQSIAHGRLRGYVVRQGPAPAPEPLDTTPPPIPQALHPTPRPE